MITVPTGLQNATPALILASASSSRLAVLNAAGLSVSVRPTDVDEGVVKGEALDLGRTPGDTALTLAVLKASRIAEPDALVIGADQILVCEGHWFDKPVDLQAARRHLQRLRGRAHVLHTAVVCRQGGQTVWEHVAEPRLQMRALSDSFIDGYLAAEGAALLSSVGAYRLEGPGIQLFDAIDGEHAAILGLPMLPLLGFLRRRGILLS